jgi:alpha-N-arabinofuranosidase
MRALRFRVHIWLELMLAASLAWPALAAPNRPNILFLFADDQRADTIGALGNKHIKTPNLDELVRRGTAFTRAYIMGSMVDAVCVPSRAMLMTGRTLFRATETPTSGIIPAGLEMWPERLRKNGYRTFGIGKWHNDTASYNRAFAQGGPIFFGGMAEASGVRVFDYDPSGEYPAHRQRLLRGSPTEHFANAAIDVLNESSAEPFVLYVSFNVPHDPRIPPPSAPRYDSSVIPLPPNFLPRHPFDNGELFVRDERLLPTPRTPEAVQHELAEYYALITHMDAQIGRILRALSKAGKDDNTIIVFAADNGLALGSHGLLGKQNLYEHSVRVPLVLAGPGIPKGRTVDALCYLLDLAPTLCELAGGEAPATSEGKSLVPVLKGQAAEVRESIFCAYRDVQRSVRDRQWKLIWYPKVGISQLFDLGNDPQETRDLADDPAHRTTIANLRELMHSWQQQLDDPIARREAEIPVAASPTPSPPPSPAALEATVTVDIARSEGRISPMLYGQFSEFMYEGIKGGLHAELLRNRSFEEPPNAIGLSRHWDKGVRYPDLKKGGGHALRIDVTNGVIRRHGVLQGGIPVRPHLEYEGYLWLKAEKFKGRVSVALEAERSGGEVYAEARVGQVTRDWQQYPFRLRSTRQDDLARFVILVEGVGHLWLDQVSLMPGDATNGIRRDVFDAATALRPAFIRWPGGNVAQDYYWQWGIGPRDQRVTWVNLSWSNEPEPSDFGTDEFIQFCRALAAAPSITVNVEGRGAKAADAAAWVDYCNGPPESKFGRVRAANGYRKPFQVTYWEIGNEIWGPWVRGHTDARTYAKRARRYISAMRQIDPTIKCIGAGDNNLEWNRTVLEITGTQLDCLAIHHYYTARQTAGNPLNLMARPLAYQRFYQTMRELIRATSAGRDIKLAINEWGLDLPEDRQYSIESAVYGARLMNVFERNSDLIEMTAVSDLVNGWPGGIIQASRHGIFLTPLYLANRLYAQNLGAERLRIAVNSPVFNSSLEGDDVPYLDATASRSTETNVVFVKLVNTHLENPLAVTLSLSNAGAVVSVDLDTLSAPSLQAMNGFNTPDAVSVHQSMLSPVSPLHFQLPKHSVSVLKARLRQD